MAVNPPTTTRLGCGRSVDDVWDTIGQPPDEHEQRCPYCTQARGELAPLHDATRELSAADQQNQDLRIPDQMLATVLAIVHTEVRRGRSIPLQRRIAHSPRPLDLDPDRMPEAPAEEPDAVPSLTVSELVIAAVVRETCDRNPDVEVRRVNIATTPPRDSGTPAATGPSADGDVGPAPDQVVPTDVTLDLEAMVSHTAAIPALLSALRTAIQADVSAQVGVTVSRIDVDVQDLLDA